VKAGDLVQQKAAYEAELRGEKAICSHAIGIVVTIGTPVVIGNWPAGRAIEVLWANGEHHKNFAEDSLQVISDA
jgi:hypothetical protein